MNEQEKSCMGCKKSVWCSTWAEFKCTVKQRRIYEPENDARDCSDFEKERRGKSEEEPKCRCKHCMSRSGEDD